jgi:hypothetical protein
MTDQPIEHPSSEDRPPAANQPSHADEPSAPAPRPTGSGARSTGDPRDEAEPEQAPDESDDAD